MGWSSPDAVVVKCRLLRGLHAHELFAAHIAWLVNSQGLTFVEDISHNLAVRFDPFEDLNCILSKFNLANWPFAVQEAIAAFGNKMLDQLLLKSPCLWLGF